MFAAMQPVAWLVSVVFWTLLAPGLFSNPNSSTFALITGPISHIFNLAFPLVELFLSTYELRKIHILFPFVIVVLYPTFVVIIHQFDNTQWPYSFLLSLNGGENGIKWGPMLGFCAFVFVCITVFFFLTLFLIKIRERIAKNRMEARLEDLELKPGGPIFEIFTSNVSPLINEWKLQKSAVKRTFAPDLKGYCYTLESTHGKLQLPKNDKSGLGNQMSIELCITDLTMNNRRFLISNPTKEIKITALHASIPFPNIPKGQWVNLCFNMSKLVSDNFRSSIFRSLSRINISGTFRLRKIFTMKQMLYLQSRDIFQYAEEIPKAVSYPPGVDYSTVIALADADSLVSSPLITESIKIKPKTSAQRQTPKYKPLKKKEPLQVEPLQVELGEESKRKDNPLGSAVSESDIPELPPIIQLKPKSSEKEIEPIQDRDVIEIQEATNVTEKDALPLIDPYTEKFSKELQEKFAKLEVNTTCDFIVSSSNSTGIIQAQRKLKPNIAPAAELFQDGDIEPWNVSNSPVESVKYLSTIDRMDSDEELYIYNENGEMSVIQME
ncbi:hypothetical protein HDV04_003594 [Boothiomyces sp. JEL0838]|nr:hypothetical protein HDV04_003594 [Boothiomyces sp. JEL0838]